jgi:hypothetical protein
MTPANTVTRRGIDPSRLDKNFTRADIEFHDVDHSGPSFDAHVYINNEVANAETERVPENGYAGTFHIFGHGGCYFELGHCDVHPRGIYDPRPDHPLTPARKVVIATDAVRRAVEYTEPFSITVVPVVRSVTVNITDTEDVLHFKYVKVVTYR